MSRLVCHFLGTPRIRVDAEPVHLSRRKALALLVFLAVTRCAHGRDKMATWFWPGYDQATARNHLRRALNDLRQALGPEWIDADRECVALTGMLPIWLDVEQFRGLLASRATHGHPPDTTCPLCLPILDEALALYQDDFLAGFTLPDAPDFDAWQREQTESLHSLCCTALAQASRDCARHGLYDQAIVRAHQLLRLEPADEAAHRHLMELYARTGQTAAALRQYARCVQELKTELGIAPGQETNDLKDRVAGNQPAYDAERPPRLDAGSLTHRQPSHQGGAAPLHHNLPAPTTPLVGRKAELADLAALLADRSQRLITILGPGGMGKSRLAQEAAAQFAAGNGQAVCQIQFTAAAGAAGVVVAIGAALGIPLQGDESASRQQLLNCLQHQQLLLLLESAEHLQEAVDLLQEILEHSPHVRLLVTSRARLHLMGETVYTLGGLLYPTWELPPDAANYDAIQLFLLTARRACQAPLVAEETQYVARICRLVGGMPLGIILAAAWVDVLTPAQIAEELTHSLDLLTSNLHDLPERQRNMRGILRYAWGQLGDAERQALMRLSVFHGGFSAEAAQLVAGATLPILAQLGAAALIQRVGDSRYTLHELLGQYAAQQLAESGAGPCTEQAHCSYYLDLLHQSETALAGPEQLAVISALELDFDNLQAAWRHAVHARRYQLVDRALDALFRWMWMVRNHQYEGRAWLRLAREEWAPADGAAPHPVYGRILARVLDVQASWLRNPDVAAQRAQQALVYAQAHNNAAEAAFCHWILGVACMGDPLHNYSGALQHFALSMRHYAGTGDCFQTAQLLQDIGHACHQLWRLHEAAGYLDASLALRRQLGDRIGEGYCLSQLGANAYKAGNLAQAASHWHAAYARRRECNDRQGIAHSLFEHSLLALTRGDWHEGRQLAEEALAGARGIGSTLHERYAQREIEVAAAMAAAEDAGYPAPRFAQIAPGTVITLFYLVFGFDDISVQYPRELARALRLAQNESDLLHYMPFAAKLLVKRRDLVLAAELLAMARRTPAVAQGWVSHLPDVAQLRTQVASALHPAIYRRACHRGQKTDMAAAVRKLLSNVLA